MRIRNTMIPFAGALTLVAGSMLFLSGAAPYRVRKEAMNFVRPGLIIKVTAAEIATDGTIRARVKLTDPKGAALEREGVNTPGPVSVSFIAAYIPAGQTQYRAYTTRVQVGAANGVSAEQASADSGGTFRQTGEGEYEYTFRTRAPQTADRTATHSIGAYGSRNLTEFDLGTQYDDDVYNFVPNGSKPAVVRDVIRTATCNKCHFDMGFHGGSRKTMELCNLCHQPQTVDPDTGNSVDMAVFIHKIHAGSALPSVRAGRKYQIIGREPADYSTIAFPADVRNCVVCHEAGAAQAENVFKPSRAACGSCHDNVNFDTGENHVDLPQRSDNECAHCHVKQGELEFDASIIGAHTVPRFSQSLQGIVFELISVANAAPGKAPTVTFSVKDRKGNAIKLSDMSRLTLILAGPNTDYGTMFGANPYLSDNAIGATGPGDGRYFWTFSQPLPADAKGSWTVGIEGRRDLTLLEGTRQQIAARDTGVNKQIAFSVDGSKMEKRRTVVATAKCNACHFSLAFHGDARNTVEECVICHSPKKLAGTSSIDFKVMIHRIHMGEELGRPYMVGTTNLAAGGYPGDRANCAACHVNGSEVPPMAAGTLPVMEPSSPINPMQPTTAACTGCHAGNSVLSHALSNTTALGESCATCHGRDAEMSVPAVHAR